MSVYLLLTRRDAQLLKTASETASGRGDHEIGISDRLRSV